ncbi:MAG: hypothetical protein N3A64_00395 [Desulfobacterota bacterium]|nr:hypothetical protein [Thermodesulfobacteriota bacterium]
MPNCIRWLVILIALTTFSCTYPSIAKQKPALPQPQSTDQSDEERVQKIKIEKELKGWENKLNEILNFLQTEIEKINKLINENELSPEEYNSLSERKRLFLTYQNNLTQIKSHQQKLRLGDKAIIRENFYLDLISSYLSTLKLIESLRAGNSFFILRQESLVKGILQSYQANNYYRVIELYQQLAANRTEESIDFAAKCCYALSLIRLNQAEEARKIVEKFFSSQLTLDSENAPLFFYIGEWLIEQGQIETAHKVFQQVNNFYKNQVEWQNRVSHKLIFLQLDSANLKIKSKLEQARLLFEEKGNFLAAYRLAREAKSECSELNCQQGVQNFLDQLEAQGNKQIEEKLKAIDEKIKRFDYSDAKAILLALKNSFPPGEYPPSIRDKLALLSPREELLKNETKPTCDSARQKLDKAVQLIATEKFEEAIILLEELESSNYRVEANEQKLLAINGLARSRRLKAGQLFLQAKHCSNPELKKSYLLESYRLLKDTLDKYPNNIYAEKIMKNLMDVRTEIEKNYPDFFSPEENSFSD